MRVVTQPEACSYLHCDLMDMLRDGASWIRPSITFVLNLLVTVSADSRHEVSRRTLALRA
jgi:hypothetical protein